MMRLRVLLVLAALAAAMGGCASEKTANAADARHFVEDFFAARLEGGAYSGGVVRTLDEMLPNVRFQEPNGTQRSVSDYVVVGRFVDVKKGRGFRVDGVDGDGTPTDFDDSRSRWRTAHVTVAVERSLGGPAAPERFDIALPAPSPADLSTYASGLRALGQVVVFATRTSVQTAYDSRVHAPVQDLGIVLAAVDSEGRLSLPFMEADRAAALLSKTPTLATLETAARLPQVIPVTGTPGSYRRAP